MNTKSSGTSLMGSVSFQVSFPQDAAEGRGSAALLAQGSVATEQVRKSHREKSNLLFCGTRGL